MIQEFVDKFIASEHDIKAKFAEKHPDSYQDIVRLVIETISADTSDYDSPDPDRIHTINDGDYQGTLVFVIGAGGYQPSQYWYVKIYYGSCSGCDTLEAISSYSSEPPTPEQVNDYWTLALHVCQGLGAMQEESV